MTWNPARFVFLDPFLVTSALTDQFSLSVAREVCNHYKWWLGAQSLVQKPKLVPFLFPVPLGILGGTLRVLIQRTILLLGSVSNSFSPHKDKHFGSIQCQGRAFVLYCQIYFGFSPAGCWWGRCCAFSEGYKCDCSHMSWVPLTIPVCIGNRDCF